MRKLTSREIVLLVVVGGVALLGWSLTRNDNPAPGLSEEAKTQLLSLGDPPVVQLARLDLPAESYDPNARNLFAYYTPPPPPQPARQPVERVVQPVQEPVEQAPPLRRDPPQPPRPQAPRPSYKYIGFLGPKENRIAVLESGKDIILARLGEVVEGKFKVVEFKYEALVLGYTEERWKGETAEIKMNRK